MKYGAPTAYIRAAYGPGGGLETEQLKLERVLERGNHYRIFNEGLNFEFDRLLRPIIAEFCLLGIVMGLVKAGRWREARSQYLTVLRKYPALTIRQPFWTAAVGAVLAFPFLYKSWIFCKTRAR